jgi:hypothetical protein
LDRGAGPARYLGDDLGFITRALGAADGASIADSLGDYGLENFRVRNSDRLLH